MESHSSGRAVLPQAIHQPLVALGKSKGAVAADGVLSGVLLRERSRADQIGAGGLEALHKTHSGLPHFLIRIDPGDELRKSLVGQIGIGHSREDSVGLLPEIGPVHAPSIPPALMPLNHFLDCSPAPLRELENGPRPPMDELGAEFQRDFQAGIMNRPNPPADPVSCFEKGYVNSGGRKRSRCRQASDSSADD